MANNFYNLFSNVPLTKKQCIILSNKFFSNYTNNSKNCFPHEPCVTKKTATQRKAFTLYKLGKANAIFEKLIFKDPLEELKANGNIPRPYKRLYEVINT